jgi:hypothetical protein
MAQEPFDVPLIRHAWITTLLRYKVTHYSHLTHVDMEDPFGAIGYWHWERTAWSFPGVIQDLVREQAVALLVEITYPNPTSSMTFYCEVHLGKNTWLAPMGRLASSVAAESVSSMSLHRTSHQAGLCTSKKDQLK